MTKLFFLVYLFKTGSNPGAQTLGLQQYTRKDGKGKADVFVNAIKHDFKSKNPSTRWSDIIKLK